MEPDQFGGQLGWWCWTDHTDKILASGSVAGRSPVFLLNYQKYLIHFLI